MSKTISPVHQDFSETLRAFDGEAEAYREAFDAISREIPFSQILLVTTLPRGGTQILQPTEGMDASIKVYSKGAFSEDSATWQAIIRDDAITENECVATGSLENSPLFRQWMEPNGWRHVAAARVSDPVLTGYPGAIHFYRRADEPAFSAEDVRRLKVMARELGDAVRRRRELRFERACGNIPAWQIQSCCRQFVFDSRGHQVSVYDSDTALDDRLKSGIRQLVTGWLAEPESAPAGARIELPDSRGEMWAFRATYFQSFSALGDGPFVFFCFQPPACEWDAVQANDFRADPEIARLIPTLKFMYQEFHRSPTLDEIASKAHLSPFHFHRRFTELLGQTPKHFLLSCQIQQAKRMLMERKRGLADIASECGFAHQSHFTSRFKQATGLTPTRWRRLAIDLEASGERAETPGCAA